MNAQRTIFLSGFNSLLFCLAGFSPARAGGGRPLIVRYVSPLPNSEFNLPGSNLIIRIDRTVGVDAASRLIRRIAGANSERLDASRLASGVYFYRLNAGSFTSPRKILLVR